MTEQLLGLVQYAICFPKPSALGIMHVVRTSAIIIVQIHYVFKGMMWSSSVCLQVWTVGIFVKNECDLNQAFFKYGEVKIITNVIFKIDIFFSWIK